MNRFRFASLSAGLILCIVPAVFADEAATAQRLGVVPRGASATSYSVEVPVLARVQGSAFFRTFIAFVNNTNKNGVTATYQFSYTCVSASCSPQGGFYRTTPQVITLQALGG